MAQTVFVRDTFTAGANQLLEAHAPDVGGAWTRLTGASGIQILAASDDARNAAGDDTNDYANAAVPPSAEYVIGVNVLFTSGSPNGLVEVFGRGNIVTGSGYLARVQGNGTVSLIRVVAGVRTVLATTSMTLARNVTHTVLFSIRNSAKEVYVDGVLRVSSTDNTVTGAGVVGLGMRRPSDNLSRADDFFAATFSPTAIDSLEGEAVRDKRRALLTWRTIGEVDNLGFRVYRETIRGRTMLTSGLIAGSTFIAGKAPLTGGSSYRWIDEEALPGARYWIEEIDLRGTRRWHGPFVPVGGVVDERVPRSRLLTELTTDVVREHTRVLEARSESNPHAPSQFTIAAESAVKIHVPSSGWYRVTRADLLAAGLDAGAGLRDLQLFADGREVPITVEPDGAIRFYGVPLDSAWSAARVYWLVAASTRGERIDVAKASRSNVEQTSFRAVVERRDKQIFFTGLRTDDGDGFFGPVVSSFGPGLQTLTLHGVVAADADLTVTMQGGTEDVAHSVGVSINGHDLGTIEFFSQDRGVGRFTVPAAVLREGSNEVSLVARNGDDDVSVVESVKIVYSRDYRGGGDSFLFSVDSGKRARLTGFTSLLDVTDPARPVEVELLTDATGTWAAPSGRGARVLVAARAYASAERVEANEPSQLHAASGLTSVIIAPPEFLSAAETLRELRAAQGMTAIVASTRDIYDEFSFGSKDPHAIRAFLAQTRPRFAVLLGDASYDSRDYTGGGALDLVPTRLLSTTWIRTASDSWFGDFDGDGVGEVVVGRLPARNAAEAAAMVAKIVAYETSVVTGDWTRRALVVTDRGFGAHGDAVSAALPETVGAARPTTRAQLLTELNAGAVFVEYGGHGSVETWGAPRLLTSTDARRLGNGTRLPFVSAITCLNGYFHDLFSDSLAEALLRSPNGGAIAVWASSALTDPVAHDPLAEALAASIFAGTIGDAVLAAQREARHPDVRRAFVLFGDPATRLRQ